MNRQGISVSCQLHIRVIEMEGVSIGHFLDIEGLFNCATEEVMKRDAEERATSRAIFQWIMTELEGRMLSTECQGA